MHVLRNFLLILAASTSFAVPAFADADDVQTDVAWESASTAAAPCGAGQPSPGHVMREIKSVDGTLEINMTVKQDGTRLCYVVDDIAEAPVLRVSQGDHVIIHLANAISDVAAIDAVAAPKKLDEPNAAVPNRAGFIPVVPGMYHPPTGRTNLHLHGFPIPPVAPQDEVMKRCADPATDDKTCGSRTLTYEFVVPATMPAGIYWYHPHVHGEAEIQVQMGLAGAFVVEGQDDMLRRAAGLQDRVLMVRERFENDDGPKVDGNAPMAHASHSPVSKAPISKALAKIDVAHEVQCSQPEEAAELTLNGAPIADGTPADADLAPLTIPPGRQQLWRVVNASADTFLNLALVDQDGHALPLDVVGRDGMQQVDDAGRRMPAEHSTEPQLVPPAGRIELMVSAPPQGTKAYLVSRAVDTGCVGDANPARVLGMVAATADIPTNWPAPQIDPASRPAISPFYIGLLAHKTDRVRTIAFTEYPRPGVADAVDFYMTEIKPGAVMVPVHMDAPPTMTTQAGSVEEWVLENWTQELHAFHIHQVHFRVLEVNGVKEKNPPLLDVVNIPYAKPASAKKGAPLVPGRVRIKLEFPPELAGDIPFHCHLMEHEDNGMMGVLRVVPRQAASLDPAQLPGAQESAELERLLNPPVCRGED
jgi:FtsP/CotA-like multicopper oxidase with cupredoxin domain